MPLLNQANGFVSDTNAQLLSTYTNVGWSGTFWEMGTPYPRIKLDGYFAGVLLNQAPSITDANSRKEASYVGYAFGTKWAIVENSSRPFLLKSEGTAITDPPLTSRKVYVFVKEDPTGSLFHNGKVYKSLRQSQSFASVTGVNGAFITHYYGGDLLQDSMGNQFNFLFSGVQDPNRPGGYGDIQELTSRRLAFRTDRSNNAVFYYGMLPPVPYDGSAHVSTPVGVTNLALYLTEKSNIRMVTGSGNIMTAGLVLPNSFDASKLRVMTASGIRAFQNADKVASTGEPTQGEIDLSNEQDSDYEYTPPPAQATGIIAPGQVEMIYATNNFSASFLPSYVYDGDLVSQWYGTGTDQALITKLTSNKIVNKIRLLCSDGRAQNFYIDGYNENGVKTRLGSFTRANNTVWQEFTFSNQTAYRFYDVGFTGALYSGSNVSVTELELIYN